MYIIRIQKKNRINTSKISYNIVVTEKQKSVTSKKIKKKIGSYDQQCNIIIFNINSFIYWIYKGASLSKKVYNLLNISTKLFIDQTKKNAKIKF